MRTAQGTVRIEIPSVQGAELAKNIKQAVQSCGYTIDIREEKSFVLHSAKERERVSHYDILITIPLFRNFLKERYAEFACQIKPEETYKTVELGMAIDYHVPPKSIVLGIFLFFGIIPGFVWTFLAFNDQDKSRIPFEGTIDKRFLEIEPHFNKIIEALRKCFDISTANEMSM